MDNDAMRGLVIINGADIWTEYGAFLTEEKKGGRENLTSLLTPAKAKGHTGVDIREQDGVKYSAELDGRLAEREITLHIAIYAPTRSAWADRYRRFMTMLRKGNDGWLSLRFPTLGMTLRCFYMETSAVKPLTYLWQEGAQAGRFKVKLKEPQPTF